MNISSNFTKIYSILERRLNRYQISELFHTFTFSRFSFSFFLERGDFPYFLPSDPPLDNIRIKKIVLERKILQKVVFPAEGEVFANIFTLLVRKNEK